MTSTGDGPGTKQRTGALPPATALAVAALAAFFPHPAGAEQAGRETSESGAPPGLSLPVAGQYTTGGCLTLCEDIGYCVDADFDASDGGCTLEIDIAHPGFEAFAASCPQAAEGETVGVRYGIDRWHLACAPEVDLE